MAGIVPIPTTRVSDLFVRQRLLTQIQVDQRDVFRLQQQVSTGRRISLPSEDAPAALRAASLQKLLERKEQVRTNLTTNQGFLSASDSALGNVSALLTDIRGAVLSVADTTSGSIERETVAQQVDRAIQQLVDVGNQQFRGRFLFAGSKTTQQPFDRVDTSVRYRGNEGQLRSYSDIDLLFETTITGNEVFGALSEPVRGSTDLNPVVTEQTLLADLQGGLGISKGSIQISDGSGASNIDLSFAVTVGDVARLIESNPPPGRSIFVNVTPTGLQLEIDSSGGSFLTVREVGAGTTANELGIHKPEGTLTGVINGDDLNPQLKRTTPLDQILGSRAWAVLRSPALNNDLRIEATEPGDPLNGVVVQLVDDDLLQAAPGLSPGNETAELDSNARAARASVAFAGADNDLILTADAAGTDFNNVAVKIATQVGGAGLVNGAGANYDAPNRELTITLDSTNGSINATDIAAAIETDGNFSVSFDDSDDAGNDGSGTVDGGAVTIGEVGNTGNSGGAAGTLYVNIAAGVSTAAQVAAAINDQVDEFSAEISLSDATSLALAGVAAVDVNATATTTGGSGEALDQASGLRVENGGETYDISFTGAQTVEDLLNILNASGAGLLAEINADGNGIDVRSRLSGVDFAIGENGGTTATQLGVRSFSLDTQLEDLNHGLGVHTVEGTDFTIVRNDGVQIDVDLTGATTIGDVIDRINNHPENVGAPATAHLFSTGLNNDFTVTAAENGTHLNDVRVQLVDDAALQAAPGLSAGSEVAVFDNSARAAKAALTFAGADNDLILEATTPGVDFNQVTVSVTSGAVGSPSAIYDPDAKVLSLDLESDGTTTANQIITALAGVPEFAASLDTSVETTNTGAGPIAAFSNADFATTGNSGGDANTLYINIEKGVSTAQQVADAINSEGTFQGAIDPADATSEALAGKGAVDINASALTAGGSGIPGDNSGVQVVAQLAEFGNGIDLVDDNPFGADEQGEPRAVRIVRGESSLAAFHLGLIPQGESEHTATSPAKKASVAAVLNGDNNDIVISGRNAGTKLNGVEVELVNLAAVGDEAIVAYDAGNRKLTIDVEFGTTTAQTVIGAINSQAGGFFEASLGDGDDPNSGAGTIDAADAGAVGTLDGGTADILTGADPNPQETKGAFTSLLRLKQALLNDDIVQVERNMESLDEDLRRLNFGRAEIGARQQALDVLETRLDAEEIELRESLSNEIDVDFTAAISELQARQFAFEASLRTAGSILQLTLLNFL